MKKLIVFVIALILLFSICGCSLMYPEEDTILPGLDYSQFENPKDIQKWLYTNFEYRKDIEVWEVEDYWQTVLQTYELGTGDCDDFAIIMSHVLHTTTNIEPYMVVFAFYNSEGDITGCHAVVSYDGVYYESRSSLGRQWNLSQDNIRILYVLDYSETMHYASLHGKPFWRAIPCD